ncbi:MAG TPA: ABC transporter permease, partial [Candidatus Eisenbacteria bacterium]|nr:ABC transporter permease [Candidatus Eisenbacteria bacterium]
MKAIWTIAKKDLTLLLRNRAAFFWVLGFPIMMALFFGSLIGGGGEQAPLSVSIVDLDGTDYSRAIAERLRASEALEVKGATLDSARTLVRKGELVAYVALHPGTGKSFGFGGDSLSGIEIGVDPRRRAEKEYLRGLVTAALFETMRGSISTGFGKRQIDENLEAIRADSTLTPSERVRSRTFLQSLESFLTALDSSGYGADMGARAADSGAAAAGAGVGAGASGGGPNLRVVEIAEDDSGPRTGFEVTFPSSIAWALIGVCMSFAVTIVTERLSGTFLRLRLAPVSRGQVVAGKGLACFLAALFSVSILLGIGIVFLHVRVSNPTMLAAAIATSAFCFTGVMMLVSTLGRTHESVAGAGWAIMLVMSMTGGG